MSARVPLFVAVVFLAALRAEAQPGGTPVARSETVFTEEALAERWRLSNEEWEKYRTLMQGPRGLWSPNLDPITVLGIAAETDAERRRYAELLVMVEYERVEKELRFQRAYDEAAHRLFPTLPRVTTTAANAGPLGGVDRLAFLGSIDEARCPSCARTLKRWLRTHPLKAGPVLDLVLSDAGDDEALRRWAQRQGVSAAALARGEITLHHATGTLAPPASAEPLAPRFLQRVAGQWQTLPLSP